MTDYTELKRLAEQATPGPWKAQHPNASQRGSEVAGADGLNQVCADLGPTNSLYIAAANPAVVLELIAEIEQLRAVNNTVECRLEVSEDTLSTIRGCLRSAEGDIDQLKAENDLLRKLASDTGQELRNASSWICREVEAGTKSATHWAIRLHEKAGQIDAAMGKGERS